VIFVGRGRSAWCLCGWVKTSSRGIPHVVARLAVDSAPSHFRAQDSMHVGLREMCQLLLSDFKQNWNLSTNFSKTPQYEISWSSIQQLSSFYMRRDRQTDVAKLIVSFLQRLFADASKNILTCNSSYTMKSPTFTETVFLATNISGKRQHTMKFAVIYISVSGNVLCVFVQLTGQFVPSNTAKHHCSWIRTLDPSGRYVILGFFIYLWNRYHIHC
jgi:hypothetical protein